MKRALLLLALVAAAGCNKPPGSKVATQIKAIEAEQSPDKLLARGRAFADVGDFTRAEEYFAAALKQGADRKVVLPLLLRVCVAEKRYRVAIDYAEPELRRHPDDFRLRFVLASFYATVGDVTKARAELERVLEQQPNQASVHYALAVLLRDEQGDVVQADQHFRAYLRIEPRGAHAEEARGGLLKMVDHGGQSITNPPSMPSFANPDPPGPKVGPPPRPKDP